MSWLLPYPNPLHQASALTFTYFHFPYEDAAIGMQANELLIDAEWFAVLGESG